MGKPILCTPEECCGCAACASACPKNAIEMVNDDNGFVMPRIDESKCIECGICEKKCIILNSQAKVNNPTPEVYASWNTNASIRWESSSGGAFSAFAESILGRGGVVYGVAWEDLKVKHIRVDNVDDLYKLRKSKYLQSAIESTFSQAKHDLDSGHTVLFSGTPCQIAGLYSFLGKKVYPNLYTVDFICHGVNGYLAFDKYIEYLEAKFHKKIVEVNFRDKRYGVESNILLLITFNDGKTKKLMFKDNSFYHGFINSLFLRSSCYYCKFNGLPRIADISLADCRALGDCAPTQLLKDRTLGYTTIIINSSKGLELSDCQDLGKERRPFDELLRAQPHLSTPPSKPQSYDEIQQALRTEQYDIVAKKYFGVSMRHRCELVTRRVLGPKKFYKLGLFVKMIIHKFG